jgi:hypothetical protein
VQQRLVEADVVGLARAAGACVVDCACQMAVVEIDAGGVLDAAAPVSWAVGRGRTEVAGPRRCSRVKAAVALAVLLRLRPGPGTGVRPARIHDRCSGAEVVSVAKIAGLADDAEESRIAPALARRRTRVVFRAAVGGACVADDRARLVLERVVRARHTGGGQSDECADCGAALLLDLELGGQRVRAAVCAVPRLIVLLLFLQKQNLWK